MTAKALTIIGSGGHAKVAIATAQALGWTQIVLADDAEALMGTEILGLRVTRTAAAALADASVTAVIAIGNNETRARLARTAACTFTTLVHPAAHVAPAVTLGEGTVVFAGAVVQPATTIGPHSILNTGCSVDHDCVLGLAVHLGPGVRLCGGVTVGDFTLIGVGAAVIQGIRIGASAIVGAGAAVITDVADKATVVGVPARSISL